MKRLVKCPHCGQVQQALVIQDGKLYAAADEIIGSEILGYKCPNCGGIIHWGRHKTLTGKQKIGAR